MKNVLNLRSVLVICFFLCTYSLSFAADRSVTFNVKDKDGNAIPKIYIIINHTTDTNISRGGSMGDSGTATFTLPDGNYEYAVMKGNGNTGNYIMGVREFVVNEQSSALDIVYYKMSFHLSFADGKAVNNKSLKIIDKKDSSSDRFNFSENGDFIAYALAGNYSYEMMFNNRYDGRFADYKGDFVVSNDTRQDLIYYPVTFNRRDDQNNEFHYWWRVQFYPEGSERSININEDILNQPSTYYLPAGVYRYEQKSISSSFGTATFFKTIQVEGIVTENLVYRSVRFEVVGPNNEPIPNPLFIIRDKNRAVLSLPYPDETGKVLVYMLDGEYIIEVRPRSEEYIQKEEAMTIGENGRVVIVIQRTVPPCDEIKITRELSSALVCGSADHALSVDVEHVDPVSTQWYFNGNAIEGANASTYTIKNAQSADQGTYSVQISNQCGNSVSSVSDVSVQEPLPAEICFKENLDNVSVGMEYVVTVLNPSTQTACKNVSKYEWRFENNNAVINQGNDIDNSVKIKFGPVAQSGMLTAKIHHSCGDKEISKYIQVGYPAGIANTTSDRVRVCPNPVEDLLNINGDLLKSVTVFTESGQEIYSAHNLKTTELAIPVSGWSRGFYIVYVATSKGVYSQKIIKK